jgi:CSLREA domain-containing protein
VKATISLRVSVLLVAAVGAALLLGVPLFYSSLASAQTTGTTIKVNTKADDNKEGNCSLREAIEAANTNQPVDKCAAGSDAEQDAILFSLGKKATITLGSDVLLITDDAGLTIDGRKAKITVSGNDAVRVFRVEPGAVFNLRNLTVADGNSFFGAGLLNNGGEVQVWNSTFSGNSASDNGGAIENSGGGALTVTNSTISGNSAGGVGGGILNASGTLTVTNSTFSGNSSAGGVGGGGIYNDLGTLEVTNSTFSGNSATDTGGGITNSSFGTLEVTNSTFSKNSANNGGGIFNFNTATLRNTIVANSTQGGNCGGGITDAGYNIDDGTSCGFSAANNSMPSTNPLLASSLAKNGGPTKTIALLKGSPALNAIPQATNGCGTEVTTDQRGVIRPQGEGCDIGAFEKKVRHR